MRASAHLTYLGTLVLARTNGILFKLVDEDKYIGRSPGSQDMSLVPYDSAIRFNIENMENQAEKKLVTLDKQGAFTENGWWLFRKSYEIDPPNDDEKQGFNIVYSGPNEYILMRDESCLSASTGLFRKVECTSKEVNKFKMCKNRRCSDKGSSSGKDLRFIKCAIAHIITEDYDRHLMRHRRRRSHRGPGRRSPLRHDRYDDTDDGYGSQSDERHRNRDRAYDSKWSDDRFFDTLRGKRQWRKKYGMHGPDASTSALNDRCDGMPEELMYAMLQKWPYGSNGTC